MSFIKNYRFWAVLLCVVVLVSAGVALWLVLSRPEEPTEPDVSVPVIATTTTAASPAVGEGYAFIGTVTEVGDGWLLVEGDADSALPGTVRVHVEGTLPAVQSGDRVAVWHTGQMMPSLPPQIVATRVEKIG